MTGTAIEAGKADGLTDREKRLVDAFSEGLPITEAFGVAGYENGVAQANAERSLAVQAAALTQRKGRIKLRLAQKAMDAIEGLLDGDKTPAATRFAVAKWTLEQAGHVSQADGDGDKPLHEMSEAELLGFLERAQKVVDRGGDAPIIDVVPHKGA